MKSVCASEGMLHIVVATKQAIRSEFYTTVVQKVIMTNLGIILQIQWIEIETILTYIHTMKPVMKVSSSSLGANM